MWIEDRECRNIIHECWNTEGMNDIMDKMIQCCMKIEEWSGGLLKDMKTKLENCRMDLKRFRSRRDAVGVQRYREVRWEYLNLLEKKEIYWRQRAKQFWLRDGDRNSRFFQKYASVRKEHNSIKRLEDDNGK